MYFNKISILQLLFLPVVARGMLVAMLWLPLLVVHAAPPIIPQALVDNALAEHGEQAKNKILRWQQLLERLRLAPENVQLEQVNHFFNQEIPYASDIEQWQQEDYWATPYEALVNAGGDCEDYVIAKYHALRQVGVAASKLRITYVNALKTQEAHMVLAYFPDKNAVPFILDNMTNKILSADKRTDLAPVYSFNTQGMWLERMKGEGVRMGNPNKLDRWTDLQVRMNLLNLDI